MRIQSLAVLMLLAGSVPGRSAAQVDSTTPVLSAANVAEMREAAAVIGKMFGVEQQQTAQPAAPPQDTATKKTMADVADKALNMVSRATAQVAATVEKAAPEVWRIMIKQQYANSFSKIVLPWGLFLAGLVFMRVSRRMWVSREQRKGEIDSDYNDAVTARSVITRWLPTVWCVILTLVAVPSTVRAVKILINPEYYAIRDLLSMVLGSSTGVR